MSDEIGRYNEIKGRLGVYREATVLIAFAELGIGDAIAAGCRSPQEIAVRIGADTRATERFLRAAEALGLVQLEGDGYVNTALATDALTSTGPASLVNMVRWEARFFRRWARLAEAVRSGQRPEENRRDEEDPEWVRDFTHALYDVARLHAPTIARALSPLVPTNQTVRVVDIGGGHGGFSIALAETYPNIEAVVFDLPPVVESTREIVAATPVADRVSTLAGDFRRDSIGEGYDIALVFGVLSGGDIETGRKLLQAVRHALAPSGHVVVRVAGSSSTASGAEAVGQAVGDLHMLLSTDAGGVHGNLDVEQSISGAGFKLLPPIDLPDSVGGYLLVGQSPE